VAVPRGPANRGAGEEAVLAVAAEVRAVVVVEAAAEAASVVEIAVTLREHLSRCRGDLLNSNGSLEKFLSCKMAITSQWSMPATTL
jgi:hypothetical protein